MGQTNDTEGSMSNMERLKEEAAACGPGCGCHAGEGSGRARCVVGVIVLAVAAGLVVRAVRKSDETASAQESASAFTTPQGAVVAPTMVGASVSSSPAGSPVAVAAAAPAVTDNPAASAPVVDSPEDKAVVCGDLIQSLGDLNTRATDLGGVFVFLAGEDAVKARAVATVIEKAADTIRDRDITMGVFTVADGSPEYANLAKQVPPPGVIAMVKGHGASAVSGDITESKLMQAFVAASSGGGCGSAPSSGCCP
ncbi:MAG: hypothetical protein HN742_25390 [Lentisphaerae bacterium]|jgi:hypothetical protein|nr:hypothetical protein [Lentisphaerota bacterium]MBT4823392.1 hypothetical protein [Lentisphaerota bacterium]MBT5612255.1 hypothetical protein [Lentisphaerota bacterium]MBT7060767.1 hypothetical protein [Lentisphaerota bacterium]MBT7845234.1 hypothetical protein [Lentisphaerota bacterium]